MTLRAQEGMEDCVVPYLIDRLADPNESIRSAAIEALGKMGGENQRVVELLCRKVMNVEESYPVRLEAVVALGRLANPSGFALAEFAEKVEKKLGKKDLLMSHSSIYLSLRASGEVERNVRFFNKRLRDGSTQEKRLAARFLGELGDGAKSAVPDLITALEDEDEMVRFRAAIALGEIKALPEKTVEALLKLISSESSIFLNTTLAAARSVIVFKELAVPMLQKKLESLDSKDRFWAIFILGDIGSASEPAIPALQRIMNSKFEDEDVSRAAEIALKRIRG
jgi:HEAT repeat protein